RWQLYSRILWGRCGIKRKCWGAAWKGVRLQRFLVNLTKRIRHRNKQVMNRGDPWLWIRSIVRAFPISRKDDINREGKAHLSKAYVGSVRDEFRSVCICAGRIITKHGNCLPDCS